LRFGSSTSNATKRATTVSDGASRRASNIIKAMVIQAIEVSTSNGGIHRFLARREPRDGGGFPMTFRTGIARSMYFAVALGLAASAADARHDQVWSDARFIRGRSCLGYRALTGAGWAEDMRLLEATLRLSAHRRHPIVADMAEAARTKAERAARRADNPSEQSRLRPRMMRACAGFVSPHPS
jgi:hypothetical protein